MAMLHDPTARSAVAARLARLDPGAQRRWGRMSVDQMLSHVNRLLEVSLGRLASEPADSRIPPALLRFLALNLPWPKGNPTAPALIAEGAYDFDGERERAMRLIDEFSARDLDDAWPFFSPMGQMTGQQWSRFQAKHLDHHLRQFGA